MLSSFLATDRVLFQAHLFIFFRSKTQGEPRLAPPWEDGQVKVQECFEVWPEGPREPILPPPPSHAGPAWASLPWQASHMFQSHICSGRL